jgi:hypothetical protein
MGYRQRNVRYMEQDTRTVPTSDRKYCYIRSQMSYTEYSKPEASALVQLRSGKIGLGSYLKKIKAVDFEVCRC